MKSIQSKQKYLTLIIFILLVIFNSCRQNSASHYFKNGSAKYQLKNYTSAIDDLDQAVLLDENYSEAYYLRALCNSNLEKYDRALKDFNKTIELKPDFKEAYINRGFYVFEKIGKFQAAIDDYNTYLDLSPDGDHAFAYNNRGYAKYRLNDYEGAMTDILESIRLNPDNSFVYKNRALIYLELDSLKLACQDLELAKSLDFTEDYGLEVETLIEEFCVSD
jgi:tetratricopeptide (TPR) repeat protein